MIDSERRAGRPVGSSLLCVLLLLSGCSGPCGLLPGGRLAGEEQPVPGSWDFAGDAGTAQLETRPGDPYSVNIAYTVVDGVLYINAGDTETQWVRNLQQDPHVKLRMDDTLYPLVAERVGDRGELEQFSEAWIGQSFFRRDPRELDQAFIYRLVVR